jgi:CTP:molybdopterin cytidylyltransferase MocA
LFAALRCLSGDVGGREVIRQFAHEVLPVEMDAPEMFLDVDTASDYEELLKQGQRQTCQKPS